MKNKLWTKNFIYMLAASFFNAMIFYLLMTTTAEYVIAEFSASTGMAGFVVSIYIIAAVFARVFAGKYIEVIGRKELTFFSLILYLISNLACFFASKLWILLVIRVIQGIAFGISSTCISTIAMTIIPDGRKGEGTGYFTLSPTIAIAAGPFIGLYFANSSNYGNIFWTCSLFSAMAIVLMMFVKIENIKLSKKEFQVMKGSFKFKDIIEKKALPISCFMLPMGMCYSGIVSFLNTYSIKIGLGDYASLFFVVYALVLLIVRPVTGILLDRRGANFVVYPAVLSFFTGTLLLYSAINAEILLLAAVFISAGHGTLMSCGQAIAINATEKHRYGLAISTFFICCDIGLGVGSIILGMLIPLCGYRGMYLCCAAIIMLSFGIYYWLNEKKLKYAGISDSRVDKTQPKGFFSPK